MNKLREGSFFLQRKLRGQLVEIELTGLKILILASVEESDSDHLEIVQLNVKGGTGRIFIKYSLT